VSSWHAAMQHHDVETEELSNGATTITAIIAERSTTTATATMFPLLEHSIILQLLLPLYIAYKPSTTESILLC
jgi:hypothetical protein